MGDDDDVRCESLRPFNATFSRYDEYLSLKSGNQKFEPGEVVF